jgi:hypothetical protein
MPVLKVSGKAGTLSYNATTLSITKWSGKINRELADSTDTADYDATTDMVHKEQIPVTLQLEVSVEGYFDKNSTQTALIADLFSGNAARAVILKIDASTTFGHGNCDVSDLECHLAPNEMVGFTCTLKSNGKWTMGA